MENYLKSFEQHLNESTGKFFTKVKFNPHRNHNANTDILEGHLDSDTMITYGIYVKNIKGTHIKEGDEFMELYIGENYVAGSTKRSNSRLYSPEKIPAKYKKAWEELKNLYFTKYINE